MGHATPAVPDAPAALGGAAAAVPVMDAVHPVEATAHRDAAAPVAVPVGRTAPPPAVQALPLDLDAVDVALLVEAGVLLGVVVLVVLVAETVVLERVGAVLLIVILGAMEIVLLLVVQVVQELVVQTVLVVLIQILLATVVQGGALVGVAATVMVVV